MGEYSAIFKYYWRLCKTPNMPQIQFNNLTTGPYFHTLLLFRLIQQRALNSSYGVQVSVHAHKSSPEPLRCHTMLCVLQSLEQPTFLLLSKQMRTAVVHVSSTTTLHMSPAAQAQQVSSTTCISSTLLCYFKP